MSFQIYVRTVPGNPLKVDETVSVEAQHTIATVKDILAARTRARRFEAKTLFPCQGSQSDQHALFSCAFL